MRGIDIIILLTINCLQIKCSEDEVEIKERLHMFVVLIKDIREKWFECNFSFDNLEVEGKNRCFSGAYHLINANKEYSCSLSNSPLSLEEYNLPSQQHSSKFAGSLKAYIDIVEFCLLNAIPSSQIKFIQAGLNVIVDLTIFIDRISEVHHKRERFKTLYYSQKRVIMENMKPIIKFLSDEAREMLWIKYKIGAPRLLEETSICNKEDESNCTETDFSMIDYSSTPQSSSPNDSTTLSYQHHDRDCDENIIPSKLSDHNACLCSTFQEIGPEFVQNAFPGGIIDRYRAQQVFQALSSIITNESTKTPSMSSNISTIYQKAYHNCDNDRTINTYNDMAPGYTDRREKKAQNDDSLYISSFMENEFVEYDGNDGWTVPKRKNSRIRTYGKKVKNIFKSSFSRARNNTRNIVPEVTSNHISTNTLRVLNSDTIDVSIDNCSSTNESAPNYTSNDNCSSNIESASSYISGDSLYSISDNVSDCIPNDSLSTENIYDDTTITTIRPTLDRTFELISNHNLDYCLKTCDHGDTTNHEVSDIQTEENITKSFEHQFDYKSKEAAERSPVTSHSSIYDIDKDTPDPYIESKTKYHTITSSKTIAKTDNETYKDQNKTKDEKSCKTPSMVNCCLIGLIIVSVCLFVVINNN
ncbi:hypothetical protein THOM_0922 [Trachipleistophora hominis]|uniref:Uncharacterized protein n=1 Tax=Trachipleistophora hominis TaxID=72359 RepID=L7JXB2_TRAHO|nr:hypothetical protein THOM_0922 [Trachipleistophora hominis]